MRKVSSAKQNEGKSVFKKLVDLQHLTRSCDSDRSRVVGSGAMCVTEAVRISDL